MTTATTQNFRAQADNAADRAAQGISDAASAAGTAVRDATRKVGATAADLGDRASEASHDLSRRVEQQPLTSVLVAAGVGFVAGLLLSRR
jgi:ElaB/YqjD/DUF883 family membrane-anchored ribosome-binding protein